MDPEPNHAGRGSATEKKARFTDEFYGLGESQFQAIKKAFDARCKKGTTKIKDKDLRGVVKSVGWNPTDKEITDMLVVLDPGNTEKIEFHSFMKIMSKKMQDVDYEVEIKEAFKVLDKDNNGFVTVEEFQYIMSHAVKDLPGYELQEMMDDLDRDGDGQIDYEDFAHIARYGKAFAVQELRSKTDT